MHFRTNHNLVKKKEGTFEKWSHVLPHIRRVYVVFETDVLKQYYKEA